MKVLIVEDDRNIAEMVRDGLTSKSHVVDVASDGADGSFLGRNYEYDAIVLDYSLPKKNGITVCKEIRAAGKSTPILFLSVTSDTDTKVTALEQGADDYITKPFSFNELSARLNAVTRRPTEIKLNLIKVGDLIIHTEKQSVERDGIPIHLTRKEFNLLKYLMLHAGIVMSRSLILDYVWTAESDPFSNTVESHIRNIRRKLMIGRRPNMIFNLPGRGYVIDAPENLSKFR